MESLSLRQPSPLRGYGWQATRRELQECWSAQAMKGEGWRLPKLRRSVGRQDSRDSATRDGHKDLSPEATEGRREMWYGRSHPGEKSELIVVALGLSPVAMNRGNERFSILHAERIDLRPVLLLETRAPQTSRRVVLLGMVYGIRSRRLCFPATLDPSAVL